MTIESTQPNEESSPPTEKEQLPHSRFGIWSFWIALPASIIVCAILAEDIFKLDIIFDIIPQSMCLFTIVMQGLFYCGLATIVSFILGIMGLFQRNTRKYFAILGITLSLPGVFVGGKICLMIINDVTGGLIFR